MKRPADALTYIRLVSLIPITIFVILGWEVTAAIIFLISLSTDLFDGWIARKTRTESKAGAEFDSLVDYTFIGFSLWWIYLLRPEFYTTYYIYGIIGLAAEISYMIISKRVAKKIIGLHLWLGKLTMALVALLFPILVLVGMIPWYIYLTIVVTLLSRAENTAYILLGRRKVNGISVFLKE